MNYVKIAHSPLKYIFLGKSNIMFVRISLMFQEF